MSPTIRAVLLCLATLALLPAGSAVAQAQPARLPLEVEGVRASIDPERRITITFTSRAAKLYGKVRGRVAEVACRDVPVGVGNVLTRPNQVSGQLSSSLRIPRRRQPLRVGFSFSTRTDVCRLQVKRTTRSRNTRTTAVLADLAVPLTQRGAVFLDEQATAVGLEALLEVVGALAVKAPDGRYPSAQAVKAAGPSPAARAIAVLPAPDATPPAGTVGLYTDGVARATAVAVTRSGRRVFVEVDREVLSTNLPGPLFDAS